MRRCEIGDTLWPGGLARPPTDLVICSALPFQVPGAPEHLAICYRECILDELLEVPFRQMGIPEGSQVKAFGSAKPLAEDPFGSVLYQLWKRNACVCPGPFGWGSLVRCAGPVNAPACVVSARGWWLGASSGIGPAPVRMLTTMLAWPAQHRSPIKQPAQGYPRPAGAFGSL